MTSSTVKWLARKMKAFAPYFAMLILPGGTLLALLLWLSQHRRKEI